MKVLYVIDSLAHGGAERSLADMAPLLRAAGVNVEVVTLYSRSPGYDVEVQGAGIPVSTLSVSGRIGQVRQLRRIIRRSGPDILHTTLFQSDLVGRLASIGTGTTVLTSLVNSSYEPVRLRDPNVSRGGFHAARSVDGWTARHLSDHFHAVSRSVKQSAVKRLSLRPERITVIERGRDRRRLGDRSAERRAHARRDLELPLEAEVVLTVGRQEFQKGQVVLLDAFERLASAYPNVVLVVAGRAGAAAVGLDARRTRSRFRDRIRFLGPREDVPELLAAADLFVLPSLYEGMPGVVVEAMALGLPVVASDIPGVRDVVDDRTTALLAPAQDPYALATAMSRVLDDASLARSLGERGRDVFSERFSLETSVRRMVALYEELAAARK